MVRFWLSRNRQRKQCNVAVIGLDGSGKSTLVNALTGRSDKKVIPTVGVSKPRVLVKGDTEMKLFDMGGSASFRGSWQDKLARSHGAVFVVDLSNSKRILEARDEFLKYIDNEEFAGKPVVIYANKEDLGGVTSASVIEHFKLKNAEVLTTSSWRVIPCVSSKSNNNDEIDQRLMDGIRWIHEEIDNQYKELRVRVNKRTKELDRIEAIKRKENKRSVAAKRKQKALGNKASASVVPAKTTEKKAIICKNKLVVGDERVDCPEPATQRNAVTGWRPFCDNCFEEARIEHEKQEAAKAEEEAAANSVTPAKPAPVSPKSPKSPASPKSPNSPLSAASQSTGAPDLDKEERKRRKREKREKRERRRRKKLERQMKAKSDENTYVTLPFTVGEKVEVNYHASGKWFKGEIISINDDKTLNISYDDGDKEDNVNPVNAVPCEGHTVAAGAKVNVRYKGKGNFFSGTVQAQNPDGKTYDVKFDDGDRDEVVQRSWIRIFK